MGLVAKAGSADQWAAPTGPVDAFLPLATEVLTYICQGLDAMLNSEFSSMQNQLSLDYQRAQEALRRTNHPNFQNPSGPSTGYQGGQTHDGSAMISAEQISADRYYTVCLTSVESVDG